MPKSAHTDAHRTYIQTLINVRKRLGVTQVQLAERLGKSQQRVSAMESGDRRVDTLELIALARALGIDPQDLFSEVLEKLPQNFEV